MTSGADYDQKALARIAKQQGWQVDKKRGKGSHYWCSKAGEYGFPIPYKLSKKVLEKIKRRLGL